LGGIEQLLISLWEGLRFQYTGYRLFNRGGSLLDLGWIRVYIVYNVYELSVPCVQIVYSSIIRPYTNTRALADRTLCTLCTQVGDLVQNFGPHAYARLKGKCVHQHPP
jgi:hypothetical protein